MLRVVVFAEAPADAKLGCELADRVFCERGEQWIESSLLPSMRIWSGLDRNSGFSKWTSLKDADRKKGRPRFFGHSKNGPRGSDYAMAYKALKAVALISDEEVSQIAVIMLRDCDNTKDKRSGLRQAAEDPQFSRYPIAIGVADKMREAWVLNGYRARGDEEEKRLSQVKNELGFDPVREPERLRATHTNELRHPKRVLNQLTDGESDREASCWRETPLDSLSDVGTASGLGRYITELEQKIVPLLGR